ncbi:hypothetical protein Ancab_004407 [Ancistrocladus abbreviatus]
MATTTTSDVRARATNSLNLGACRPHQYARCIGGLAAEGNFRPSKGSVQEDGSQFSKGANLVSGSNETKGVMQGGGRSCLGASSPFNIARNKETMSNEQALLKVQGRMKVVGYNCREEGDNSTGVNYKLQASGSEAAKGANYRGFPAGDTSVSSERVAETTEFCMPVDNCTDIAREVSPLPGTGLGKEKVDYTDPGGEPLQQSG